MNIKRRLSNLLGSDPSKSQSTTPSTLSSTFLTIEWSGHKTNLLTPRSSAEEEGSGVSGDYARLEDDSNLGKQQQQQNGNGIGLGILMGSNRGRKLRRKD